MAQDQHGYVIGVLRLWRGLTELEQVVEDGLARARGVHDPLRPIHDG